MSGSPWPDRMRDLATWWPDRMQDLATWWSRYSTCSRLATGAVIVNAEWQVLVSGYNGAPRGAPHCNKLPFPLLDAGGHCLTCLHAEANCLLQAARLGVALRGEMLFTTHRPCIRCANMIVQVGLAAVYYALPYDSDGMRDTVHDLLERSCVYVRQLEPQG